MRAELAVAERLVVVGDGVLGAEVAATGRGLGLDVTLAGPQSVPMASTPSATWPGGGIGGWTPCCGWRTGPTRPSRRWRSRRTSWAPAVHPGSLLLDRPVRRQGGQIPADAEVEVVEGDTTARRFVALFRSEGAARGVLGWNMPKQTRVHRRQVAYALTLAAL